MTKNSGPDERYFHQHYHEHFEAIPAPDASLLTKYWTNIGKLVLRPKDVAEKGIRKTSTGRTLRLVTDEFLQERTPNETN